jgi:hypothetical protein
MSFELTEEQKKMLEQRQCKGGVFTKDHVCKRMTDIWPRSGWCEQCRHYFYADNREQDDDSFDHIDEREARERIA